jgi:cytidine deaminase
MTELTNDELIARAAAVVSPRKVGDYLVGDVGAALLTDQGHVYVGVCIDAASGMGFCAEHSAIAAMVTAGEFKIKRVVAVWKDAADTYVLAPCGRCREFMRQLHPDNLEAEVILGQGEALKLSELLPMPGRFQKLERPE